MQKEFPFHSTNQDYPQDVYHDKLECPEGLKIKLVHRKPGTAGRILCEECKKLSEHKELVVIEMNDHLQ